jgi:hypothetical protein
MFVSSTSVSPTSKTTAPTRNGVLRDDTLELGSAPPNQVP